MHGVRKRILVIEDERDIAELIRLHLVDLDFFVTIANDGHTGLRRASAGTWDLVILDLRLPGIDGLEVCRRLRQTSSSVPVLMLTSKSSELDRVVGLEIGADDYVTKPFSLRELMARIRAQLRRLETAPAPGTEPMVATDPGPAPIYLDAVTVDLAGHRLVRDGVDLPVKPKAFELLAFLVRHPGQVFSRDQLLEKVWGYDYPGETRTVDVHVHWLRSAIEADPSQPRYLQTVRGVGYVLRLPEA